MEELERKIMNDDKRLVETRVRNRLIEHLEFIQTIPVSEPKLKSSDIVNGWDDWVQYPVEPSNFPSPPYTEDERFALLNFSTPYLEFCRRSTPWPATYEDLVNSDYWQTFYDAAMVVLKVLNKKGKLPEK
jgi:hypothetical protein